MTTTLTAARVTNTDREHSAYTVTVDNTVVGTVKAMFHGKGRSRYYWMWVPADRSAYGLPGAAWCPIGGYKTRDEAVAALTAWQPPTTAEQATWLRARLADLEVRVIDDHVAKAQGVPYMDARIAETEAHIFNLCAILAHTERTPA